MSNVVGIFFPVLFRSRVSGNFVEVSSSDTGIHMYQLVKSSTSSGAEGGRGEGE